jgi:hypothetical protein
MITEPAVTDASAVPAEISETIGNLHRDIEKLTLELTQAREVWQSTLASERAQFSELLKHKELAWAEQENQWARQSQAYEQRLEELKSDFEMRLKQTEQNASQALAQLDDDWQRDKLEWKNAAGPDVRASTCLDALEREISVLKDVVDHDLPKTSDTSGESPSLDLVEP